MKIFPTLLKNSAWLVWLLVLATCSTDDAIETQSLTFSFTVQASGEHLVFGTKKYLTPNNQQLSYEELSIYLSNVQLRDLETNEVLYVPDSYHLISFNADQSSASFVVDNIPASYQISEIKLSIGVDQEANSSIDHVGDLDPTNGMAWDWNTGYKFFLMDGRYFPENDPIGEEVKMHIGTDKNYFNLGWELDFPISMLTDQTVHFVVDAFAPLGSVDFSQGTVFMNDERGDEIAQNYKDGLIQLK